ncbi:MAG TPA: peptidylprolyl isomerase [Hyphomicrobiaceae bacterium]|jgi:peptidyl-prolyl cis-trans isomerase C
MVSSLNTVPAHALRRVVSVNGIIISQDAISQEAQNHPSPTPIAAWTAATRALVVRELLLQEARSLGIKAASLTDENGRRETDEEALIRGLIETCVTTPSPDADACRRYYERNKARFRSPEIFECSHILIAARKDQAVAFEAARGRAEVIRGLLLDDPSAFADLAATHSDCSSRATSGNLGQITSGMTTPEFERALFDLEVGEISQPIETRYGFHIIHLIRRIAGEPLPFCAARPTIECYLAARSTRTALAQFISLIAGRAELAGVELPSPRMLRVH